MWKCSHKIIQSRIFDGSVRNIHQKRTCIFYALFQVLSLNWESHLFMFLALTFVGEADFCSSSTELPGFSANKDKLQVARCIRTYQALPLAVGYQ